jgi:D-aspartate ligase
MPLAPPAVVLGEGYSGATMMGVVRSLGRLGIPVSVFSSHPDSPARFSRYCRYVQAPDAAREPRALEALLLEHAKEQKSRPIIFPIGDLEVLFLAQCAERLQSDYRFVLAKPELIRDLTDKQAQYEIAAGCGMQTPRTYPGLNSANARSEDIEFPVVIKPVHSHFWPWRGETKALSAANTLELQARLREMERRQIRVVVQSIIPGPTSHLYTVIAYASNTTAITAVATLRKLRQFPVDFGFGSLNETVRMQELESQAVAFLRRIDFCGVCGLEFKLDPRDGRFKFIEMNPRFELAHHLAATAGVDVARAMYADLSGIQLPLPTTYQDGLRWICLPLDVKASRALFAKGELSFSAWIRSMRNIRTEALLTWDDPWPALRSYGRTLRYTFSRSNSKLQSNIAVATSGEVL